jgi:hypothetical protein
LHLILFKKLPKAGISAKQILPTFVSTKQKTNTYDKQKKQTVTAQNTQQTLYHLKHYF